MAAQYVSRARGRHIFCGLSAHLADVPGGPTPMHAGTKLTETICEPTLDSYAHHMTEGSAPAGWYPDGQGRHRWWDGSQWTDEFRQEDSSESSVAASDVSGRRLEVKSLEGVATLVGTTLTLTFGRLAGSKRGSSPVSVDILSAHEIQVIEPGKFKPGLLRIVMDPDQPDVPYSTDPYAFIFAAGRRLKEVKAFLNAVGEVSPSGLSVAAKSVNASLVGEMGDAIREAAPELKEAAAGVYEGLVELGEVARKLEGIDVESDFEIRPLDDNQYDYYDDEEDPPVR